MARCDVFSASAMQVRILRSRSTGRILVFGQITRHSRIILFTYVICGVSHSAGLKSTLPRSAAAAQSMTNLHAMRRCWVGLDL